MARLKLQVRRDTAANWTSVNPILLSGELGFEIDSGRIKIGREGLVHWNDLDYSFETTGAPIGTVYWADIVAKPSTFTPATHSQPISSITNLSTALDDKAAVLHTHSTADITNFSHNHDSLYLKLSGGTITGSIVPEIHNTLDLGSTTHRFKDIWTEELHLSGSSLYLGDTKILGTNLSVVEIKTDIGQHLTLKTDTALLSLTTIGANANINLTAGGTGSRVQITSSNSEVNITGTQTSVSGDLTAQNNVSVSGNLTVTGNLTVNGTNFSANVQTVNIEDSIMLVNYGEVGSGVTNRYAGIQIDRGELTDYQLVFDENDDMFKFGAIGSLETIASHNWVSTQIPTWSTLSGKPTTLAGYGITDAQGLDADLTAIGALAGTTGILRKTAANTWSLDTSSFLTANQSITLSGDISGSGTTAISTTLSNSGVTAGTYNNSATTTQSFTVDAKGRITATGIVATITPAWSSITSKPTTLAGYGITDAQGLDADLTAIGDLAGTTGLLRKTAANTWTLDSTLPLSYLPIQRTDDGKFEVYENVLSESFGVSLTGTVQIMLPYGKNTTMLSVILEGYNYNYSRGYWRVEVSGYNYSTGWANSTKAITGNPIFGSEVRLGWDTATGNGVILLGNTSTVWNYSKVLIRRVITSHTGMSSDWSTGWSITTTTDESGLNEIVNPVMTGIQGNAGTATALATERTLAITGDLSWTSPAFDGSANVTAVGTLANSGVTAGTYNNSATSTQSFTVDAKGRITTTGTATTITPAWSVITSKPTTLAGYGITDAQGLDADLTAIGALAGTTGLLRKTAANTWSLDTSSFLTANQSITLSGDLSGSGTTAITAILDNSGVTAGTYNNSATQTQSFTVDAKGRVTGTGSTTTITPAWASITSKPTTLAGYGITDAQGLDADLTAIGALAGTTGLLRKTAANTWTLDSTLPTANLPKLVFDNASIAAHDVYEYPISSALASTTGTIKITLPYGFTNTIITIIIEGNIYTTSYWRVECSGYLYATTSSWYTRTMMIYGNPTFGTEVRVGYDSGLSKAVILLGNTTTNWGTAPRLYVSKVAISQSGMADDWSTGWTIEQITDETGITGIYTPTLRGIQGNAGTATELATGRTIGMTGDLTWTSPAFDGTANVTAVGTLANSGVTAGTYNNSATTTQSFTVDAKGRVTGTGSTTTITPAWASITSKPTTLAGYGITDAQGLDADLTAIGALAGTTGLLRKTAANTWSLDTSSFLTANQSISLSGDISGSGTTTISTTLANSGVTAGTYNNSATSTQSFTVDAKGRITGTGTATTITPAWSSITSKPTTLSGYGITDAQGLDADLTAIGALAGTTGLLRKTAANTWSLDTSSFLTANQSITLSGDLSGSGTTTISTTLANSGVTAGTYNNSATTTQSFTVDAKGRITTTGTATTITPAWSSISSKPTTLSGYGITDAQPVDADLTAIGALSATSGLLRKTAANTWNLDTTLPLSYLPIQRTNDGKFEVYENVLAEDWGSPVTGTIQITLPNGKNSTMLCIILEGYNYNPGRGYWRVEIGAYNSTNWTNTAKAIYGNPIFGTEVRLGYDASNNGVILLGNTTTVWNYPKVLIRRVLTSYTGMSADWGINWSMSLITDESAITGIVTPVSTGILGNAATATALDTGRTLAITGDLTWTSPAFDGSANVTAVGTLANSGVTAGTYNNSATTTQSFTVDAKGRVTGTGSTTTITPAWASITSKPTTLAGYGITDAQGLDADLTAIGALASTSGLLRKTADNTWTLDSTLPLSYLPIQRTNDGKFEVYENILANVFGASVTGTIQIMLPYARNSTMLSVILEGYNYNSSRGYWRVEVSGYTYVTGWVNSTKAITGNPIFGTEVRLGWDTATGNGVILIGNTSTVWTNSKVLIRRVLISHSGTSSDWSSGWSITTTTDESGLNEIVNPVMTGIQGNAETATTLATGRTLAITGDLTWISPAFDGSGNVTAVGTLANSGVTAGTYNNSATQTQSFTVDAKGRVTGTGTATTITPAWSSITSKPTTLAGYGITDAQGLDADLTAIGALAGTTGLLRKTAANTWSLDTSSFLTANQSITLSGDLSGSGTTAITAILDNSGVTAGTYNNSATTTQSFTVDAKGRVTGTGTATTITPAWSSITSKPTTLDGAGITGGSLTGVLSFGSSTRQMLNLYSTTFAIGVQNNTLYHRTNATNGGYAWFQGGVHSSTQNDPGTGGTLLAKIDAYGDISAKRGFIANHNTYNSAYWSNLSCEFSETTGTLYGLLNNTVINPGVNLTGNITNIGTSSISKTGITNAQAGSYTVTLFGAANYANAAVTNGDDTKVTTIYGAYNNAYANNSGSAVTSQYGSFSIAQANNVSSVGTSRGSYNEVRNGSTTEGGSSITNATGVESIITNYTNSVIETSYLFKGNYAGTGVIYYKWGLYLTNELCNYISNDLGLGTTEISARLHAQKISEQLRLSYDSYNYASHTVGSSGILTIMPTGSSVIYSFPTDTNPNLGVDIFTTNGWTVGSGWTESPDNTFAHTSGTVALSHSVAIVSGTRYYLMWTITGRTAGSITITFGGHTTGAVTATGDYGPTSISTAGFTVTPTTDFNGTCYFTLQVITGVSVPQIVTKNSVGTSLFELRSYGTTNLFLGLNAGAYRTSGIYNLAVGTNCLMEVTSGDYNTSMGHNTQRYLTVGIRNTAFGYYNQYTMTIGNYNTSVGYGTQYFLTSGNSNTAMGHWAQYLLTTGSNNTALGYNSNYALNTGSGNVAIGYEAGRYHANGSTALAAPENSIYIGKSCRGKDDNDDNSIVIGNAAIGLGANTTVLGNSSTTLTRLFGDVGIEVDAPSAALHAIKTTEQLRLGYDSTHYFSVTVASDGTTLLKSSNNKIRLSDTSRTPASATAAGVSGEICWDTNYVYICVATNTWKRAAVSTW